MGACELFLLLIAFAGVANAAEVGLSSLPEGMLGAPEKWGLVPSTRLNWHELPACSPNKGVPCLPPPPVGYTPLFLTSIQRHGSRTPAGAVSDLPEFAGVVDEQLTQKGVRELHEAGAAMRVYFEEFYFPQLKTQPNAASLEPAVCRRSVVNTAEDLAPSVFIRSSCYPRTRLSGYAWAAGFDGVSVESLVPDEVLTSGNGGPGVDPSLVELHGNFPFALTATGASLPGAVSSTVYPVYRDPLMLGNNNPFRVKEVVEWERRVFEDVRFRRLQSHWEEQFAPLAPFLDRALFSKLGWDMGDAFHCEVQAGVRNPLERRLLGHLERNAAFRNLSSDEKAQVARSFLRVFRSETGRRAAQAFANGFRIAFYLMHTSPGFMHMTAGGALLLVTRLMQAKAAVYNTLISPNANAEAALSQAVMVLTALGGFDYLVTSESARSDLETETQVLRETLRHMQQTGEARADQKKALQKALRCLSLLLFAWHDSMIISMLGLLGLRSDEVTPFASSMQLELLRKSDSEERDEREGAFFVRLMYGTPGREHRSLEMPFCEASTLASFDPRNAEAASLGLCSLEAFVRAVEKHESAYGGVFRLLCRKAKEFPELRTQRTDLACFLAGMPMP